MMGTSSMYARAIAVLKKSRSVLIASHYHPDGDALGSTLALALGLRKLGKKVFCHNRDPVPFNLSFLPFKHLIHSVLPRKVDCVVMADCAQPKRVSDAFKEWLDQKQYGKLVCMDHHLLDHKIGDVDLIDPRSAATGCVVWKLLEKMKVKPEKTVATLIYTTLVVDTGFFRYSNTTADVLRLAADLVKKGADPWFVSQHLEESNPFERYLLLGRALQTLETHLAGRYATMLVTRRMLEETGAYESLSDEFANFPRSIRGVEVAALFREVADGRWKVSLRSKNEVDVSSVAKQFGGGGHEHAAGCYLKPPLAIAQSLLKKTVAKALK